MRFVLCALVPLLAGCEAVVIASNVLPAVSAAVAQANKIPSACFFDASYRPGEVVAVPVIGAEVALFVVPPPECVAE